MADKPEPSPPEPSPIVAGLTGRCPRCNWRTLFDGWLKFADRCDVCGLDFSSFNVGDGAAAFLTLIIGGVVAAMAITIELVFSPPFWLHALLWPPVALALIVGSLRGTKGILLALEYRNAAREGRISK
jgi:uncharacterized protein (DUF983 family)